MTEWIVSLTALQTFFALSAAIGGGLFLLRAVMMLAGGIGDLTDADASGLSEPDSSFQFFSLQGLTAFFMMFGLVGLALSRQSGAGSVVAVVGGLLAGVVAVWLLAKLFVGMNRLNADGTLRIENAIGQIGEVYLGIPAVGSGQVRVTVQGQLRLFDAVSASKEPIRTGARVRVAAVADDRTLSVEVL